MHNRSSLQKRDVYLCHVELQPRLLEDGCCSPVDGVLDTLGRGRQDEVRTMDKGRVFACLGHGLPSLHNLETLSSHRPHGERLEMVQGWKRMLEEALTCDDVNVRLAEVLISYTHFGRLT